MADVKRKDTVQIKKDAKGAKITQVRFPKEIAQDIANIVNGQLHAIQGVDNSSGELVVLDTDLVLCHIKGDDPTTFIIAHKDALEHKDIIKAMKDGKKK